MPSALARPVVPRRARGGAFTLVELLVSVTILTVLTVMTAQMVGSAARVTNASRQRMEADSQARTVLDRIGSDLARMLKRPDVDCLFAKRDGGSDTVGANDAFYFLSEAPAYFDASPDANAKSTASLIGYRINSKFQLERLGKGLTWDGAPPLPASSGPAPVPGGPVHLTYPTGSATANPASTLDGRWPASIDGPATTYNEANEPDAHVLADGVFRLEICFLLTDGKFSVYPVTFPNGLTHNPKTSSDVPPAVPPTANDDSTKGYAIGSRWFDNTARRAYVCKTAKVGAAVWESAGVRDVAAVVVALGVLDPASRRVAPVKTGTDANGNSYTYPDLTLLLSALPDPKETALRAATPPTPTNPLPLPANTWLNKVNGTDGTNFATTAGLPRTATSQVRLYQRLFYLNPTP